MLTSNPSIRNKSLRACYKVAHVEMLQGDAPLEPRYALTAIYGNHERSIQKIFSDQNRVTIFVTPTYL